MREAAREAARGREIETETEIGRTWIEIDVREESQLTVLGTGNLNLHTLCSQASCWRHVHWLLRQHSPTKLFHLLLSHGGRRRRSA